MAQVTHKNVRKMKYFNATFYGSYYVNQCVCFKGPLCSVLVNRFGCRPVMMVGGLFASLGIIVASFATSIIHIYLGAGVITGRVTSFSVT